MFIYVFMFISIFNFNNICHASGDHIIEPDDQTILTSSKRSENLQNTQLMYADIYKLRDDGLTRSQIRKKLNITEGVLNRAITKHDDYKVRRPASNNKSPSVVDISEETLNSVQELSQMG